MARRSTTLRARLDSRSSAFVCVCVCTCARELFYSDTTQARASHLTKVAVASGSFLWGCPARQCTVAKRVSNRQKRFGNPLAQPQPRQEIAARYGAQASVAGSRATGPVWWSLAPGVCFEGFRFLLMVELGVGSRESDTEAQAPHCHC